MTEQYANLIFLDSNGYEEQDLTTFTYISNHIHFEYFVGYEITTLLDYKNPNEVIRNSVSKCNQIPYREYPGIKEPPLNPKTILITRDGACEILLRTRKLITPDVTRILQKFNINITNKKRLTKEQKTLSEVTDFFKTRYSVFQYPVDKYKLDLYFPSHRLIIECDENGHNDRNPEKERERMDYVNLKLKITDENWLRFNPDDKDFYIIDFIKAIQTFFDTHLEVNYRICCDCKINKPLDEYHKNKYYKFGREYRCKVCRSSRSKERLQKRREKLIIPKTKVCSDCEETKPSREFWYSIVGRGGLTNLCKTCFKKKRKEFTQKEKTPPRLFTCCQCGKIKNTVSDFHKKQDSSTGYNTSCKSCINAYGREWKFQRKVIDEILLEIST